MSKMMNFVELLGLLVEVLFWGFLVALKKVSQIVVIYIIPGIIFWGFFYVVSWGLYIMYPELVLP